MTTTKIMQACDGRIDTSGVCDKCYQPAMTTSTQCGRLVEAHLTTPDMDIQKQIEKESKWYESPQAFKEGANFVLGLCQKEIAELKEEVEKLKQESYSKKEFEMAYIIGLFGRPDYSFWGPEFPENLAKWEAVKKEIFSTTRPEALKAAKE